MWVCACALTFSGCHYHHQHHISNCKHTFSNVCDFNKSLWKYVSRCIKWLDCSICWYFIIQHFQAQHTHTHLIRFFDYDYSVRDWLRFPYWDRKNVATWVSIPFYFILTLHFSVQISETLFYMIWHFLQKKNTLILTNILNCSTAVLQSIECAPNQMEFDTAHFHEPNCIMFWWWWC